ncbi:MAG: PAS domain S-box protein [Microthrixaceae bacterium]
MAALRRLGVLDTPDEERFDRITRLAAQLVGTPIALVSLVDEQRQWFKSRVGLDATETPRSVAFCSHAIEGQPDELFVVPDAHADLRFCDNPLVTGDPHVRFYAGRVIREPSGQPMGTLCVIDHQARDLSDAERQALDDLGALVEQEFVQMRYSDAIVELDASERSKAHILESLSEGLVLHAPDGRIVEWNPAAERVLGLSGDEMGGRTPVDPRWRAVRPDGAPWPGEDHPASRVLRTAQPVVAETMGVHRPDGSLVWLRVSAQPTLDAANHLTGVVASFEDITTERALEASLAESVAAAERTETQLRVLAESLPIGIYRAEPDGRCVYANTRWREVYGLAPDDEMDWVGSIHRDDVERVLTDIRRCASSGQQFESTFRVGGSDAVERWARATASPVRSVEGSVEGFVGSVEDITERRRAEVLLAKSAERLERSNRELAEFASVAAHDLAEPLRVIEGYLHVLRSRRGDQLDDDARSYIGHAIDGAERLQDLIDDLLSYSRATTESAPFTDVDLATTVGNAVGSLEVRVAETNATVEVGPLPVVSGNPRQLEQLFQNLIANALKFTAPGDSPSVEVSATAVPDGWQIDVADHGIGIASEHRERVFGMFKRLNGRDTYEGTGIGLAICRKVVDAHQGRIWVADSEHGTVIRLVLPHTRHEQNA